MNEERLKILQMVEEKAISVEEAIQLLDALKGHGFKHSFKSGDSDQFEKKVQKFVGQVDCFAKEFGGKMEDRFREMEPKIKNATKIVIEKTAKIVDDISCSLNESIKNMESEEGCGEGSCGCNDEKCECKDDNEPKEN